MGKKVILFPRRKKPVPEATKLPKPVNVSEIAGRVFRNNKKYPVGNK